MKKFAKILLACLVLLLALIAMLLGYSEWIVSDARHYTYDQVDKVPYNRVAVVLGTSKYLSGGGPNHYFKYRIKAAAELYNNAKVDFIIVSGDNATVQYNEPRQMRRALIKAGIPASAIYMDFAGFRTLDSVVRAKEVFGQERFTVVSPGLSQRAGHFHRPPFRYRCGRLQCRGSQRLSGIRTRVREVFARLMGLLDLYVLDKGPKFLGAPVPIGLPVPCQSLSTIGSLQPCLKQPKPAVDEAKPAAVSAAVATESATSSASATTKQVTPALSAAATTEPVTPVTPSAETAAEMPSATLPTLPVAPSAASVSTATP